MQYNFRPEEKIFSKYPELVLVEEFENLSDPEMKWTILFADFDSPYRGLKGYDKSKAIAEFLKFPKSKTTGDYTPKFAQIVKSQSIEIGAAVAKYKKLYTDEEKEDFLSMIVLRDQIRGFIRKENKSKDELKAAMDLVEDLADLNLKIKQKRELMQGMTLEDDGGKVTVIKSAIDEFMEKE